MLGESIENVFLQNVVFFENFENLDLELRSEAVNHLNRFLDLKLTGNDFINISRVILLSFFAIRKLKFSTFSRNEIKYATKFNGKQPEKPEILTDSSMHVCSKSSPGGNLR